MSTVPVELLSARSISSVQEWNAWRTANPHIRPDLHGSHLLDAFLQGADLHGANLDGAFLRGAHLYAADLRQATMRRAVLVGATLSKANLTGADLEGAILAQAQLNEGTIVEGANLRGCRIYGVAAWGLVGEPKDQTDLLITLDGEAELHVDNIEIAQFIYLLLRNSAIRGVIDTLTSKVVLILGSFSAERKPVLDALRIALRKQGLVPVLFDFEKPASKDVTGTVETLARMAQFVVADLTAPSSIPHELATIVPFLRTTPVVPIRSAGASGYSMFSDMTRSYPWVEPVHEYPSTPSLLADLSNLVENARSRATQLRP